MTGAPHRGRVAAALGAAAIVVATGGLLAWRHGAPRRAADAPLPVRDAPRSLPAGPPRLAWRPVAGDAPGAIASFTVTGDTIVALDPPGHRVLLLRADGDSVRVLAAWGRRGGGPGELREPAALAHAGAGRIAIADAGGRVRRFDLAGGVVATDAPRAPCAMFAPALAYARDGRRWMAGNCAGDPPAADTIFTVVHELRDGAAPARRARAPRMALDLSWGSALATLHPLADLDTAALFATGLDACTLRLDAPADAQARRCGLVRERLRAPEPASLARDRRAAEARGQHRLARLLRWPDALPPWLAIVAAPDALLLARPVSADSLVVVPAGRAFAARDVRLVAPLHGFVTCARGTCLWYDGERLATWRADGDLRLGGAR